MDRSIVRVCVWAGLLSVLASCVQPDPTGTIDETQIENTPVVAGETVSAADIYDPGLSDNRALFVAAPATMDFRESLTELVLVLRHFDPDEMTYEVSSEADWVAGAQPTGKIVGGWVWVYIQVDRNKLAAGENTAKLHARVGDYPSVDINIRAYSANGGGQAGGVDVPDVTNPTAPGAGLYLSTNNLNFGLASTELALIVASRDHTPMNYTLAADAAWIRLSSTGGPNAGAYDQIAVTVNRDQLTPGAYSGIITVATDLGDSAQVAVSALVPEPDAVAPPEMVLDTLVLEYGVAETKRSLQISNGGSGAFTYSITPRDAWITATPANGAVSTNVETVVLGIDRTNLPAGQNLGRIEVRADTGMVRDVFLVVTQPAPPDPNEPIVPPGDADDPAQIAAWLRELPPLPKVHYASAVFGTLLVEPDPRIVEFARITHSLSVIGEGADSPSAPTTYRRIVNILKSINDTNPAIPARIGVHYAPWHRVFPPDAPPTYVGPEHQAEIDLFRSKMIAVRNRVAQANAETGANIAVGCINLNPERFLRKAAGEPGAAEWNAAMDLKYNAIYDICREIFPNALVEWHGRGGIAECFEGTGWCEAKYFTTFERGDAYSVSMYRLPELTSMRESYRRTYANAQQDGVSRVWTTVALGCGFQRDLENGFVWSWEWDYPLIYSWQIGAELNWPSFATNPERYGPYNAADTIFMYPEPFSTRVPHWGKHFVAYVRGAALIRDLDDLPPGND